MAYSPVLPAVNYYVVLSINVILSELFYHYTDTAETDVRLVTCGEDAYDAY